MKTIEPSLIRFEEIIEPGAGWSHVLKRGTSLRIEALGDGANVAGVFFNYELLSERLNLPDTLKCQHTAKLTNGHCLYSDMGRVLVSLTQDDCGWHDPLSGPSTPEGVRTRYGSKTYQTARNDFYRNGRDSFLTEFGKYGLDERDLVACVNFFSKVTADDAGRIRFHEKHCRAGMALELRAEMNTLVILNTCVHPLDPNPTYSPQRARLSVWSSPPPGAEDACRTSCLENTRGFEITERYFL